MQYANSSCTILQSCLSAGTLNPQDPPVWDLLDVERSYRFGCTPAEGIRFFFSLYWAWRGCFRPNTYWSWEKVTLTFLFTHCSRSRPLLTEGAIKELNQLEPGPRTASTVIQSSLCRNKTIYRNVQYRDLIFPPPSIYIIHEMKLKLICTAALK